MTDAWLAALVRRERRELRIVGREPLGGGYTSPSVERVDLDDGRSVVVKQPSPVEVAAMRAIAVVPGVERPRMLVAAGDRIVVAHYDGTALGGPAPDEVWRTLALVHAHWRRNRPRGIPVVDAAWWRRRCEHELVALRAAADRTGSADLAAVVVAVESWADDPRVGRALAVLPRTLCHGDANRANVLSTPDGPVLIDWGSARVAPAGSDVAVLCAPDPTGPADASPYPVPGTYTATLAERLGGADPPELAAVERDWALAQAHLQYLGFAADHQSPERVTGMTEVAAQALDRLDPALHAAGA